MHVLDLFSGIGGFSLGLERAGMKTKAFCEIDPYCQKVLARHWPEVKIHDDVTKLDGGEYAGAVDLICGGYPCQPFSVAGKQLGEKDPRHLWPEMYRIIREAQPRWVVAENVRGHLRLGFDSVASQLEDAGFTVWPFVIPACAVAAPHRRDRVWILAHAVRRLSVAGNESAGRQERTDPRRRGTTSTVANTDGGRCGRPAGREVEQPRGAEAQRGGEALANTASRCQQSGSTQCDVGGLQEAVLRTRWNTHDWQTEPDVGRVADGVPARVDRLRALGNAVVPQIPELIGRAIMRYEQQHRLAA